MKLKLFVLVAALLGLQTLGVLHCWERQQAEPPAPPAAAESLPADSQEEAAKDEIKDKAGAGAAHGFVIAADDMSNLQLTDDQTPVYDRYTLAQRKMLKLNIEIPPLTPRKTDEKTAYLTFDDGPDNKNTPAVLKILQEKNVKATFYVVGRMVENNPSVLKQIFADGHAIGNHSYDHDYKKLYPDEEKFLAQIIRTEEIIHDLLGVRPLIIRAPGGKVGMFTEDYPPMLKKNGYIEHDWNIETGDARQKRATADAQLRTMLKQMRENLPRNKAPIILMHCGGGKEETVKALPQIIDTLRERGYKFGVITPMTVQPW